MKKLFTIVMWVLIALPKVNAQQANTQEDYAKKFWNYRDRFNKFFIHLGTDKGDGLPCAHRIMNYYANFPATAYDGHGLGVHDGTPDGMYDATENGMTWGDATADLGDYIARLACEYKLLLDEGKSTHEVTNEIYFALNAYFRIDGMADNYYNGNLPLKIVNGFGLRDDVPEDYANTWDIEYQNGYLDKHDNIQNFGGVKVGIPIEKRSTLSERVFLWLIFPSLKV